MQDIRTATLAAIHDALALRGPCGDGGFIRTAQPGDYMGEARLRLAREIERALPASATTSNAAQFVDQFAHVVLRGGGPAVQAATDDCSRLKT